MICKQPAEWQPHSAVWSAWPSHANLWQDNLESAQAQVAALFHAIDDHGQGEALNIVVDGAEALMTASLALAGTNVSFHQVQFGDIWLRDTAPIFVKRDTIIEAASFGFNGWGGKYDLPGDTELSAIIAKLSGLAVNRHAFILEGGSVDVDGAGLALTTEDCLLNPNRNPSLSKNDIERIMHESLGITKLIWLGDGLANDHTDGHIDNLARFIAPGHAVVPEASDSDDPNRDIYIDARQRLEAAGLTVSTIPSVGRYENEDGDVVPASYANFYISNTRVIVPLYNSKHDDAAVAAIAKLFPTRETIGLPATAILTGGGSFHCITQQVPL